MKSRVIAFSCLMLVLGVANGLAQSQLPTCVTLGFSTGTQIVVGRISQLSVTTPGDEQATVLIEQYLRKNGPRFSGDVVTIPVDWVVSNRPSGELAGRRPMWYNISPDIGKQVLLVLYQEKRYVAVAPTLRCVVDLSANPTALGSTQQIVNLDELPDEQKIQGMQQVLTDRSASEPLQAVAIQYLTSPNMRDPQVRLSILQQFAPVASDPTQPRDRRMEALDFIKWAYDSFSQTSAVNDQILSFVADQITDRDPEVRSSAVQFVSPKFVGLEKKGQLNRVHFSDRSGVVHALQREATTGKDDSLHAKKMLQALGGH